MGKKISSSLLFFLFLFAGLLSSCSQENAVLATSKIQNITANDFFDWLDAKKVKKESVIDSKDKQKKLLESMALEIFIMDKAKAEGFDRSKRLMAQKERIRETTLQKYFISTIDTVTYNEPAIRVSYIFLALKLYKDDPDDKTRKIRLENNEVAEKLDELTSTAKDIIKRLETGDSFEKLAAEFSDDTTKKSGGDYGYMLNGMMPDYFSEPAFSLEAGEYTKTPVMTPKGVYIIKVSDKTKVTEKNIDQIIEDKNQRERFKVFLIQKYRSEYVSRLMKADDVEFFLKAGETYNNTDTFCRVGAKEYIIADIEKIIETTATQEELDRIYVNGALPEKAKFDIAQQYFEYLVWSRDAARLGVEKNPKFLKELKEREINLIMTEYFNSKLSSEINISYQEIMKAYETGKDSEYSEKVNENSVKVYKPLPFEEVKDEVINELKKKAGYQIAQDWKRQLFEKYSFMINETALKGS